MVKDGNARLGNYEMGVMDNREDVTLHRRLRLRQDKYGKLVLQVGYVLRGILLGSTPETVDEAFVHYRDATVEDVTTGMVLPYGTDIKS